MNSDPCPLCSSPARITGSVSYRDVTGHRMQCRKCGNRFPVVSGIDAEARKIVTKKLISKLSRARS